MANFLLKLGIATTSNTSPDPQALSRLRVLLWAGAIALVLVFGLVLLLTVIRLVRRRYFAKAEQKTAAAATPWQAAGQRVSPVEGGQLVEGATPDDDPEGYEQARRARLDEDPNNDTGPLPDDEDGWREDPDDEDDPERW